MMTNKIMLFMLYVLITPSCSGAETRSPSTSISAESKRISKLEQALEDKERSILVLKKIYDKVIKDKNQKYEVLEVKYNQTISDNDKLLKENKELITELNMMKNQVKQENPQPLLINSIAPQQHWQASHHHKNVTLQGRSTQERIIAIDNRHTTQYNNQSIPLSRINIFIMGTGIGLGLGGMYCLYKVIQKLL